MKNQIFNIYLKIILSHMHRCGLEADALLERSGLGQFSQQLIDINQTCDFDAFLDLLHLAEAASQDPLFCARAGSFIHPGDYGKVGQLLMNCDSYGHSIVMSYRFQHLVNNVLQRRPYTLNNTIYSRIHDLHYDTDRIRPYIEMEHAALVYMSHFITGHMYTNVPITLCFRHAARASKDDYQAIFKTPLKFDCDHNEIVIPTLVMIAPIHSPDKTVFNLLYRELRNIEKELSIEPEIESQVRLFLEAISYEKGPKLQLCAQLLDTSTSTLKRRLAQLGTSFQAIQDEIRYNQSCELLEDKKFSIADIAYSLGFSSSAAFIRSFKKWSGETPGDFAKHHIK